MTDTSDLANELAYELSDLALESDVEIQRHAVAVLASLPAMRRGWILSKAMTERVLRVQQVFGGDPEEKSFSVEAQRRALEWARKVYRTRPRSKR